MWEIEAQKYPLGEKQTAYDRANDWDNAQTLCASFPALNSRLSETFLLGTLREETWDARDGEYGTPCLEFVLS